VRAVNLLPTTPRVEERRDETQGRARAGKAAAIAAALALVIAAAGVGYTFTQARSDANARRASLEQVQAELAQRQAAVTVSAAVAAQRHAHLTAFTSAASSGTAWDRVLEQLSRVLPPGAWLESLASTAATPGTGATPASSDTASSTGSGVVMSNALSTPSAAAPAAVTVTLTGYARTQEIVASVLERLALIPALSDVSLLATQRTEVAGEQVVQFTIGANVHSAEGIDR
jgi:Tfp pilus assembly protein PilN